MLSDGSFPGYSDGRDVKVAVVGTGVSGLAAAWALDREHEVVLYEADPRPGGHVHTHSVDDPLHGPLAVDSGFIVYNERNYPGLVGLLSELGVATRESDMSFAVTCRRCRLEFCGRGAAGLFAERRNMLRPGFLRLLADISRFFRAGKRALADPRWQRRTIGDFLEEGSYGRGFERHFIAPWGRPSGRRRPMTCARCPRPSSSASSRTTGSSACATRPSGARSREARGATSTRCWRASGAACAWTPGARAATERRRRRAARGRRSGRALRPRVVATHPNEALGLLGDPSDGEREALARIRYSRNEAIVHTDASMLPRKPKARASWNVALDDCRLGAGGVAITYWMNRLQGLPGPDRVLRLAERRGAHRTIGGARPRDVRDPIYTLDAMRARDELLALDGTRRTHFAGAYLGAGFHEDGLRSGYEAAARASVAA